MSGRLLVPGLIAASVLAIFVACLLGSTPLPADRVLAAFFGGADAGDRLVIWQIRLPRAVAAFFSGAKRWYPCCERYSICSGFSNSTARGLGDRLASAKVSGQSLS